MAQQMGQKARQKKMIVAIKKGIVIWKGERGHNENPINYFGFGDFNHISLEIIRVRKRS